MNNKLKGILEVILVITIFLTSSYFIGSNLDFFERYIGDNISGVVTFILIEIISIVIAPVTTLPFIVLASKLFGWFNAGIYCLIAWSLGSIIAFIIARKFGVIIVKRFMSLKKIHSIENKIPKDHLLMSIIFLRIIIPMDLLSYVLGLFSKVNLGIYSTATIIGLTPLAFGLAYFGEVPFYQQLLILILLILIISWALYIRFFIREHNKLKGILERY